MEGQQVATIQEYTQQAADIAYAGSETLQAASEAEAEKIEWMPLGVFALATSEEDSNPQRLLQLAVSKDGLIGGTYYNSASDEGQPIEGKVDRESQRAAFTIGEEKWPVLETGIFNLTKDETPLAVHFRDDTQTWWLIRLESPDGKQAEGIEK